MSHVYCTKIYTIKYIKYALYDRQQRSLLHTTMLLCILIITVTSIGRKRKADKQKYKIKFKKTEMVFREGQVTNRIL